MLFREIRVSLDDGLEAKEEQNKWGDIRSHAVYARIQCIVELHQGLDSSAKVPTAHPRTGLHLSCTTSSNAGQAASWPAGLPADCPSLDCDYDYLPGHEEADNTHRHGVNEHSVQVIMLHASNSVAALQKRVSTPKQSRNPD